MTSKRAVNIYGETYARLAKEALARTPDTDQWLRVKGDGTADIEERYALGAEQTRDYVSWAAEKQPKLWKDARSVPAIEMHLTASLGGVKVQGYIDQLIADEGGKVRVRDLKTGSTKSKFQLATYGALVASALGIEAHRGDWYLAKTGKLSRPVDISEKAGHKIPERFQAMDAAVKRGDFPARPGFQCRFCGVSHACSFGRRA